MNPKAVYDTNVIVSVVLKPGSIPASLVALAMQGAVQLYISPVLLAEYREVLKRSKFGLGEKTVDHFLEELETASSMVYPKTRGE